MTSTPAPESNIATIWDILYTFAGWKRVTPLKNCTRRLLSQKYTYSLSTMMYMWYCHRAGAGRTRNSTIDDTLSLAATAIKRVPLI
ncbi:UNVERIFIED_CONTAM: hypothetical protein NCL1_22740 [Trichonephila clavipes]